jgi:hypothetical protein
MTTYGQYARSTQSSPLLPAGWSLEDRDKELVTFVDGLNRFAVDRRAGVLPLAIFLLLISQLSFL